MEKRETRAARYGRLYADFIVQIVELLPDQQQNYKSNLLKEIERYSFKPRREGQPRNERDACELSKIERIDIRNPKHLARLIKEGAHLMYQKRTSRNYLASFKRFLRN